MTTNISNKTSTPTQLDLALIHHTEGGEVIDQRSGDGYINATALCKAAGKSWSDYRRHSNTGPFLAELSTDLGVPTDQLVHSISGGDPTLQGTWVHPQVAVNLGQYLSPKFAVRVSKWVADWLAEVAKPQSPARLPVHLERYIANDSKVPPGHFSILQETGVGLFGPLHQLGFDIPKGWVPDISVGKYFCAHLRDELNVDTAKLPTYSHDYLDGRQVPANAYPDTYLATYRTWFREKWLPEHGRRYFKSKSASSLIYVNKMPALNSPTHNSSPASIKPHSPR